MARLLVSEGVTQRDKMDKVKLAAADTATGLNIIMLKLNQENTVFCRHVI